MTVRLKLSVFLDSSLE